MVKVYGGDKSVPIITVGRDRLKDYSKAERDKAKMLKNPQGGWGLAAAIAANVADPYFDKLAGDKETQTRLAQAAILEGKPYLAALAEGGAGTDALKIAAQRAEADRLYARNREDAAKDAEDDFKRKVKFERIKAGIKSALGPNSKDIDIVVKKRPDGTEEIVRINKITGERLPVGTMNESVKSVVKSAKTLTGDTRPGQVANPQPAETSDATDPARGQVVMGVPTTASTPAAAAPAQAAPATAQPVPQGVNVAELYKERAKRQAKAEAEAPEIAAREAAKREERVGSINETLKALYKIRQFAEPQEGMPSQLPESSSGALGYVMRNIPGTDASDAYNELSKVQSEITIGTMKQLKELSATGATGFGSISKPELVMLQNSLTTLNQTSSPEEFREQVADTIQLFQVMRAKAAGEWTPELEKEWQGRYQQYWGKYGAPDEKADEIYNNIGETKKAESEKPKTRGRILRKLD